MRKTLLAAAALAPLCLLASRPASAQTTATTVSSSTSTPISTAQDGAITINSGVTIQPTTAGTAAVVSNANIGQGNVAVTNNGGIEFQNLNNVVGIQGVGGSSGDIVNLGNILVSESYTPTVLNGINEAPFASPSSLGRYGIQITGAGTYTGNILNETSIEVQGNSSYGISVESPLVGSITNTGTLTLTGDNGVAIRTLQPVTGSLLVTGAITVIGANSNAIQLGGSLSGGVSIYSTLTTSDYGLSTRPLDGTTLQTIEATPTQVLPNGGTVLAVQGSVGTGIFLGAPPQYTNSSDVTSDRDGDGILDSEEGTAALSAYGQNPALLIGGGTSDITIGNFVASSSTNLNNNYGLVIEGSVTGNGVYDEVPSTAVQIGGPQLYTATPGAPGGSVTFLGGVLIAPTGSVTATAYGSTTATAFNIGAGANIPQLNNQGIITATINPPNSTTSTFPSFTAGATAIEIGTGAVLSSLVNSGTIGAIVSADANDQVTAVAVQDKGGGLSSVTNTGSISGSFTPDQTGAIPSGIAVLLANGSKDPSGTVALDLSNNTSGVTLVQSQPPNTVITTNAQGTTPVVTVSYQPVTVAAGGTIPITTTATVTTTTANNITTETIVPVSPTIIGDIYLGNGSNTVDILAGTVTGALSMGAGPTAAVTIDNGAIYYGSLSYSGTGGAGLTLNVNNGVLDNTSPTTFKTSSLTVGSLGTLYFAIDPQRLAGGNTNALYNVSGAATFAKGAQIGLVFDSNIFNPATYTIVSANTLNIASGTGASLLGPVPYMFNATLLTNQANGSLQVEVSQKTPAQLGLNPSQAAALPATYQALTLDTPVQAAFLGQYTKAGFLGVYNQILPDYAGGTFQAANAASLAIGRTTGESNEIENPTGTRGAWVEEILVGVAQGIGRTDGFQGGGFGFVGGLETGGSGLGAFGVTTALVNTTVVDPHVPGDSQTAMTELELGGYWQGEFNGLLLDARVAGGYLWFNGRREFLQLNSDGDITLDRKVQDDWNGYSASGRFGAAYRLGLGNHFLGGGWFVQPQAHLDTFFLYQNGFNESEAQGGPALAMGFGDVNGHEASGTASILIGRKLGQGLIFRPEIELGVRDTFTGTAGDLTAHYISGGPSFTLTPAQVEGAAGVARFRLKASSEYYEVGFEAGTEILSSRYEEADTKVSVRVLF